MASTMHVPAWKKLGLKLKNEEQFSAESNGRRHMNGLDPVVSNGRMHSFGPGGSNLPVNGYQSGSPALKPLKPLGGSDQSTSESSPNPRKRKSVSFTPETKTSDGKGFKHLYDQFLITHPNGKRPTFKPVVGTSGLSTFNSLDDTSHKAKKAKKSKRLKESKSDKDSSVISTTLPLAILPASTYNPAADSSATKSSKSKDVHAANEPVVTPTLPSVNDSTALSETPISKTSPPLVVNGHSQPTNIKSPSLPSWLEYLHLYHTSPTTWKFSKSKQSQLLKHTFDFEEMSDEWDPALAEYWGNCEGDAVCKELQGQANKVLGDLLREHLDVHHSANSDNFPLPLEPDEAAAAGAPESEARVRDKKRRNEEYDQALHRDKKIQLRLVYDREEKVKELDPAWRANLAKRQRATLILNALGNTGTFKTNAIALDAGDGERAALELDLRTGQIIDHGGYEKTTPRLPGTATQAAYAKEKVHPAKKRARKRKRRTGVPDDDSSSSEAYSLNSGAEEDLGGLEMQCVGATKPGGWTGAGLGKDRAEKAREIKKLKLDRQAEIDAISIAKSDATSLGVSVGPKDEDSESESTSSDGGSPGSD